MKDIYEKIFIIIIFLFFICTVCFAEENKNTVNNDISNEVVKETTEAKKEEKPAETIMNKKMYVQERCNIRDSYSKESNRVGGLDVGTEVTVIAEYSNGWYKIKYDGGEAYIKSAILRSAMPVIEQSEPEPVKIEENNEENSTEQNVETMTEEEVLAGGVIEEQTENEPKESIDEKLANEIGVMPEVGHNMADYLFILAILCAMFGIIFKIKL